MLFWKTVSVRLKNKKQISDLPKGDTGLSGLSLCSPSKISVICQLLINIEKIKTHRSKLHQVCFTVGHPNDRTLEKHFNKVRSYSLYTAAKP